MKYNVTKFVPFLFVLVLVLALAGIVRELHQWSAEQQTACAESFKGVTASDTIRMLRVSKTNCRAAILGDAE